MYITNSYLPLLCGLYLTNKLNRKHGKTIIIISASINIIVLSSLWKFLFWFIHSMLSVCLYIDVLWMGVISIQPASQPNQHTQEPYQIISILYLFSPHTFRRGFDNISDHSLSRKTISCPCRYPLSAIPSIYLGVWKNSNNFIYFQRASLFYFDLRKHFVEPFALLFQRFW